MIRNLVIALCLFATAAFGQSTISNAYTWRTNLAPDLTLNQLVVNSNITVSGQARTNVFMGPTMLAQYLLISTSDLIAVSIHAQYPGNTGVLYITSGNQGPAPYLDRGGSIGLYGVGQGAQGGDADIQAGTNGVIHLDGRYSGTNISVMVQAAAASFSSNVILRKNAKLWLSTNMYQTTDGGTNLWIVTLSPSVTTSLQRVDYVP